MAMYYALSKFSVKEGIFHECHDCGNRFNIATGHACVKPKKRGKN